MTSNTGETVVFWITATLAVIGALGMVLSKKAVHSALWIAMTMINLAILYIAQDAAFLGMVQIIVYTGAVMMLFLFVLMLVGVDASDSLVETLKGQRVAAVLFAGGIGVLLITVLTKALGVAPSTGLEAASEEAGGGIMGLARLIFSRYLLAFEVTSALLITAALGAMVLAHRERHTPRKTQADMARDRFLGDQHPGQLPSPGVYARTNAVDTPALLPDGTVAELSIPGPLKARGDVRSSGQGEIEAGDQAAREVTP